MRENSGLILRSLSSPAAKTSVSKDGRKLSARRQEASTGSSGWGSKGKDRRMDHHLYAEFVGVAAAAASLYAANSRTIIPLRVAAIVANALAMIYSFQHGTYPTFVLNAVLLPLNAWRLHGMLKLIRDIDAAAKSDLNAEWLLPYMRPMTFKAGDIMMTRGEYA